MLSFKLEIKNGVKILKSKVTATVLFNSIDENINYLKHKQYLIIFFQIEILKIVKLNLI